jgi:hypothetical protein
MSDQSDPKLLEKLKGVPPYGDETPTPLPAAVNVSEVSERTKEQIEKLTGTNQELKQERDTVLEENQKLKEELNRKNLLESMRPDASTDLSIASTDFSISATTPAIDPQIPVTQYPAAFEPPAPQAQDFSHLNQAQVDDVYAKLIDPEGYVDPDLLKKTLKEANDRAVRAEQAARLAQSTVQQMVIRTAQEKRDFEETQKVKELHEKYPQLDPKSDKFNEKFFEAVRNDLHSQLRASGQEDVWGAVERWKDVFVKPVKEEVAEPQVDNNVEDTKRQLNALGGGSASRIDYSGVDYEDLKQRAIQGKKGALAERLRRSGY